MTRLGLVGVGAWGRRYVDSIAGRPDCRIVAYARATSATGFSLPGAQQCQSWQELVERAREGALEGIIVATTPESQGEIASAAVLAGVPSLIEKPLGMSRQVAGDMLVGMREVQRKPPLMVNYVHLWAPAYRALRSAVLESGGASEVSAIESEGCSRGPFRGWSSLYDYGPHDVAMCLGLMGTEAPFVLEYARRIPSLGDPGGELFEARFQLGSAVATMRVGNGAATKRRRLAVRLRGGRVLVYDDLLPHPNKLVDGEQAIPVSETRPLEVVLADFLQQVEQWHRGSFSGATSVACLELSHKVGTIVDAVDAATRRPDDS